jgi:hypothetical protein
MPNSQLPKKPEPFGSWELWSWDLTGFFQRLFGSALPVQQKGHPARRNGLDRLLDGPSDLLNGLLIPSPAPL